MDAHIAHPADCVPQNVVLSNTDRRGLQDFALLPFDKTECLQEHSNIKLMTAAEAIGHHGYYFDSTYGHIFVTDLFNIVSLYYGESLIKRYENGYDAIMGNIGGYAAVRISETESLSNVDISFNGTIRNFDISTTSTEELSFGVLDERYAYMRSRSRPAKIVLKDGIVAFENCIVTESRTGNIFAIYVQENQYLVVVTRFSEHVVEGVTSVDVFDDLVVFSRGTLQSIIYSNDNRVDFETISETTKTTEYRTVGDDQEYRYVVTGTSDSFEIAGQYLCEVRYSGTTYSPWYIGITQVGPADQPIVTENYFVSIKYMGNDCPLPDNVSEYIASGFSPNFPYDWGIFGFGAGLGHSGHFGVGQSLSYIMDSRIDDNILSSINQPPPYLGTISVTRLCDGSVDHVWTLTFDGENVALYFDSTEVQSWLPEHVASFGFSEGTAVLHLPNTDNLLNSNYFVIGSKIVDEWQGGGPAIPTVYQLQKSGIYSFIPDFPAGRIYAGSGLVDLNIDQNNEIHLCGGHLIIVTKGNVTENVKDHVDVWKDDMLVFSGSVDTFDTPGFIDAPGLHADNENSRFALTCCNSGSCYVFDSQNGVLKFDHNFRVTRK